MKPINAENPITAADVGRLAVRRDGDRVKVMRWDADDTDYPVLDSSESWLTRSGHYRTHEESPRDLTHWADEAPAPSPLTIDMTIRVPLDRVSALAAQFEVLGTTGPQANAEDTQRASRATTTTGAGQ